MLIAYHNSKYQIAPAGLQNIVCIDSVDLGLLETEWGLKRKLQYIFATDAVREDGKQYYVFKTLNASLHEKSSLRKFHKGWLGRDLTEDELLSFDSEQYIGESGTGFLVHNAGKNGKTYANLENIMPAQGIVKAPFDYVRVKDRVDYEPAQARVHPAVPDISRFVVKEVNQNR